MPPDASKISIALSASDWGFLMSRLMAEIHQRSTKPETIERLRAILTCIVTGYDAAKTDQAFWQDAARTAQREES